MDAKHHLRLHLPGFAKNATTGSYCHILCVCPYFKATSDFFLCYILIIKKNIIITWINLNHNKNETKCLLSLLIKRMKGRKFWNSFYIYSWMKNCFLTYSVQWIKWNVRRWNYYTRKKFNNDTVGGVCLVNFLDFKTPNLEEIKLLNTYER